MRINFLGQDIKQKIIHVMIYLDYMQKNQTVKKLGHLASTCNSTIIETYVDIIRVSHGFEYCQSLGFIAITCYLRSNGIRLQYL